MIYEIKSWYDGKILYSAEADSLLKVIEMAVSNRASLDRASLDGASLDRARLDGASLDRASLDRASLVGASLVGASLDRASLVGASLARARLDRARLDGASLDRARLDGARLDGASLDENTILQTGETWKQYLEEVLPALLIAGGKPLDSFEKAWQCHSWENCPMAHAFDVTHEKDTPLLLRPRVRQFVQLFDAKLIQWPLPMKA